MRTSHVLALVCALGLGGCSYAFDVEAVMIDGRLAFRGHAPGPGQPRCVTRVEVIPETQVDGDGGVDVRAEPASAWKDDGGYDCRDRFPVFYGEPLHGEDAVQVGPDIEPAVLQIGVVYNVHIIAGATGYGGGRFRLLPGGRVENLGPDRDGLPPS